MENPKCPYCGREMKLWDDGYGMLWYSCPKCLAEAPVAHSEEAAYTAAMKRDRAKGYLLCRAGHYWEEDGTDYPDICVYVNGYCSECGQVLCRAGATTIHYPDELMYTDKDWDYRKELIEAEDKLLEAATQRKVGITNFCPNCGAEMKEEKQDENNRSNNKIDNEDCLFNIIKEE